MTSVPNDCLYALCKSAFDQSSNSVLISIHGQIKSLQSLTRCVSFTPSVPLLFSMYLDGPYNNNKQICS